MAGEVRISAQKVWEEMQGVKDSLGKIESFMEKHVALQEQTNLNLVTRLDGHSARLGAHDSSINGLNSRMSKLEDAELQREKKRAPWWQVLASVALGITLTLLVFDRIAPVFAR